MIIHYHVVDVSSTIAVLSIYADLVVDSLTEFAYDADLAGLAYNFGSTSRGVYATFGGYNDKMAVLAKDILERARNLQVKEDRLNVMKEQVRFPARQCSPAECHDLLYTGQTRLGEFLPGTVISNIGLLWTLSICREGLDYC